MGTGDKRNPLAGSWIQKMLYAIMMLSCRSPDVTKELTLGSCLRFFILTYLFFQFLCYPVFWNSALQNTTFSPPPDLMKSLSLFPPSFASLQIQPPSPLSLPFLGSLTAAMQQLPRTPLLLQRRRRGLRGVQTAGGERTCRVTMTRADGDGGRRRLFRESPLERLNDIWKEFPPPPPPSEMRHL